MPCNQRLRGGQSQTWGFETAATALPSAFTVPLPLSWYLPTVGEPVLQLFHCLCLETAAPGQRTRADMWRIRERESQHGFGMTNTVS